MMLGIGSATLYWNLTKGYLNQDNKMLALKIQRGGLLG